MGDFSYLYGDLAEITGDKSYLKKKTPELSRDEDLAVRTIIGEAKGEGRKGWEWVGGVIRNRAKQSRKSFADVVLAPSQFEPWSSRRKELEGYDPNSPTYRQVAEAVLPILRDEAPDPTGGATHFYSPGAQSAFGRKPPSWDDGTGVDIGNHRFFRLGYAGKGQHGISQTPDYSFLQNDIKEVTGDDYSFLKDDIADLFSGEPVPESHDTIQMQEARMLDPASPRFGVLYGKGQAPTSDVTGSKLFPMSDGRAILVHLAKAKKNGLKDDKHIQTYIQKNPDKAIALFTNIPASANVGTNTASGNAVLTTVDDKEAISTVAPTPESVPDILTSHQAQFPDSTSQLVPTQDVADMRLKNAELERQGVAERYVDMTAPEVPQPRGQAIDTSYLTERPAQPIERAAYTKRDTSKPGSYYEFEKTGKAGEKMSYLGMRSGKHYAQDVDGDIFELTETKDAQGKQTGWWKAVSPFAKTLKFEDGKQFSRINKDGRYRDAEGREYSFTPTPTEKGFSYSIKEETANPTATDADYQQYLDYVKSTGEKPMGRDEFQRAADANIRTAEAKSYRTETDDQKADRAATEKYNADVKAYNAAMRNRKPKTTVQTGRKEAFTPATSTGDKYADERFDIQLTPTANEDFVNAETASRIAAKYNVDYNTAKQMLDAESSFYIDNGGKKQDGGMPIGEYIKEQARTTGMHGRVIGGGLIRRIVEADAQKKSVGALRERDEAAIKEVAARQEVEASARARAEQTIKDQMALGRDLDQLGGIPRNRPEDIEQRIKDETARIMKEFDDFNAEAASILAKPELTASDVKLNPTRLLPFVSSIVEMKGMTELLDAANRVQDGTADQLDLARLRHFAAQESTPKSFLYQVFDTLAEAPSFMGEIAATGGIYTGVKQGIKTGAFKLLKELVTEQGVKTLEKQAVKTGLNVVGKTATRAALKTAQFGKEAVTSLAASVPQTVAASPLRIAADTQRNRLPQVEVSENEAGQLQGIVTKEGDDFETALKRAAAGQFGEIFSEHTGGALSFIPVPKRLQAIKAGIAKLWLGAEKGRTVQGFTNLIKKAGWHGVVGEMFDERVGNVYDYARGEAKSPLPTLEQLAVEGVSFAAMGGAFQGINKLQQTRPLKTSEPTEAGTEVTIEGKGEGVIVEDKGKNVLVNHNPKTGKDGTKQYQSRSTVRKSDVSVPAETPTDEVLQPTAPTNEALDVPQAEVKTPETITPISEPKEPISEPKEPISEPKEPISEPKPAISETNPPLGETLTPQEPIEVAEQKPESAKVKTAQTPEQKSAPAIAESEKTSESGRVDGREKTEKPVNTGLEAVEQGRENGREKGETTSISPARAKMRSLLGGKGKFVDEAVPVKNGKQAKAEKPPIFTEEQSRTQITNTRAKIRLLEKKEAEYDPLSPAGRNQIRALRRQITTLQRDLKGYEKAVEYHEQSKPVEAEAKADQKKTVKTAGVIAVPRSVAKRYAYADEVADQIASPEFKEAEAKSSTERPSSRTGFTKTQTEYLAKALQRHVHTALEKQGFGSADGKGAEAHLASFKDDPIAVSVVGSTKVREEPIAVPDDGVIRIENVEAANRLHQRITGKPIEGIEKAKNAGISRTGADVANAEMKRPSLGKPSKETLEKIATEQAVYEDAAKRGESSEDVNYRDQGDYAEYGAPPETVKEWKQQAKDSKDDKLLELQKELSEHPRYKRADQTRLNIVEDELHNRGIEIPESPQNDLQMAAPSPQPFYSQVERAIEAKMPSKASAEQIRGLLKDSKKEERDWLGIDEFLDSKPSFTKDEVLEFIQQNQVEINEVTKETRSKQATLYFEPIDKPDASEFSFARDSYFDYSHPNEMIAEVWEDDSVGYRIMRDDNNIYYAFTPSRFEEILPENGRPYFDSFEEAKKAAEDDLTTENTIDTTKFSQYTLPGGENYRELLLTMPEKPSQETPLRWNKDSQDNLDTKDAHGIVWEILPRGRNFLLMRNGEQLSAYPSEQAAKDVVANQAYLKRDGGNFKSGHWDEPNVLAHVRFDDRDGGKTLHIAEIQSDWHQRGREKGYQGDKVAPKLIATRTNDGWGNDYWKVEDANGRFVTNVTESEFRTAEDAIVEAQRRLAENPERTAPGSAVPNAPFKKSWPLMSFKHVLKYAVENGYERVTWDTGETNAERYDLSKQVDKITSTSRGDLKTIDIETKGDSNSIRFEVNEKGIVQDSNQGNLNGKTLEDVIGKELSEKILNSDTFDVTVAGHVVGEGFDSADAAQQWAKQQKHLKNPEVRPRRSGVVIFKGDDLKIGGSGMRGFYDRLLPNEINSYVKKWGAKVIDGNINSLNPAERRWENLELEYQPESDEWTVNGTRIGGEPNDVQFLGWFDTKAEAQAELEHLKGETVTTPVHSLQITPAMRESVMQGQTLFKVPDKISAKTLKKYANIERFENEHLSEINPKVEGDTIVPDFISHELMRTARALVSGRERKQGTLSLGYPLKPDEVQELIVFFNETAEDAKENGLDGTGFEKIANALTEAAKGDGHVIWALPEAVTHEKIHKADMIGGTDPDGVIKSFEQRYDGATDWLKTDEDFQKFHKELNKLQGITSHGAAMAEALAWLGDARHEDFSLTVDQSVGILTKLVKGYVNENGVESLKNFDEGTKLYEVIENTRREIPSSKKRDGGSVEVGQEREAGREGIEAEHDRDAESESQRSPESQAFGIDESAVTYKNRKHAEYLRRHGLDAADVPYIPETERGWQKRGREIVEASLADGGDYSAAIDKFNNPKDISGGERTALGYELIDRLGAEGDYAKMREVTDGVIVHEGNAGAVLRAAQIVSKYDFAKAVETAVKAVAKKGKTLTDKEIDRLWRETSKYAQTEEELATAIQLVAEAKAESDRIQAELDEIQKALDESNTKRRVDETLIAQLRRQVSYWKNKKIAERRPRRTAVYKDLLDKKPAMLDKIRVAFGANDALKMAVAPDTDAFKNWFADSKVVDENGEPLVVYHGTRQSFDAFEKDRLGDFTRALSATKGFFFTDSPQVASSYPDAEAEAEAFDSLPLVSGLQDAYDALERHDELTTAFARYDEEEKAWEAMIRDYDQWGSEYTYVADNENWYDTESEAVEAATEEKEREREKLEKRVEEKQKQFDKRKEEYGQGGNVMPVYLKLENPLVYNFGGGNYKNQSFTELLEEAKEEGRDGAIFENVDDDKYGRHTPADVYIVFEPNQIKSAIGNRGTFDPNDANILKMAVRDGLDEDTRNALVDYTALQILEHAKYEDVIANLKDITGLPDAEIGAIHADAVESLKGTGKQSDKVKETLAIRNEHKKEARRFRDGGLDLNRLDREILKGVDDAKTVFATLLWNRALNAKDFREQMQKEFPAMTAAEVNETLKDVGERRDRAKQSLRKQTAERKADKQLSDKELKRLTVDQRVRSSNARAARQSLDRTFRQMGRSVLSKAGDAGMEVINFLKGTAATGEISYLLRQGLLPLITESRAAIKGDWQGVGHGLQGDNELVQKAATALGYDNVTDYLNEHSTTQFIEKVREHARLAEAQAFGVRFSEIGDHNIADEHFSSRILEKVPLYKRLELAYTLPGDLQRLYIYDVWANVIEGQDLNANDEVLAKKYAAKVVNAFTGKGDIGTVLAKGGTLSKLANVTFFSPSLLVSRFQSAYYLTTGFATAPKGMRLMMAKKGLRFYTVLGLMAYLLGMNLDPDDDDFGKIRPRKGSPLEKLIGEDKQLNPLAGMDLPLELAWKNAAGMFKALRTGDAGYFTDSISETWQKMATNKRNEPRFLRGKLSPSASWLADYYAGTDYIGRPYTHWNAATSRLVPMSWGQVYDALLYDRYEAMMKEPAAIDRAKHRFNEQERDYANALSILIPTFLGVGINQYPKGEMSPATKKAGQIRDYVSTKDAEQIRIEGGLRNMIKEKIELQQAGKDTFAVSQAIKKYAKKYKVELGKLESQAKSETGLLSFYAKDLSEDELNRVLPLANDKEKVVIEKMIKARQKKAAKP